MMVAILLAAGSSRRWGAGNKLFDRAGGGATMLARSLALVMRAPVQRVIVVTGWQSARVAAAVRRRHRGARIVRAADHREGMGASLRAASRALRPIDRAALLFLADMPWVDPLAPSRWRSRGEAIVRPAWRGVPGHPVLLRGAPLRVLATARGDMGPGRRGARLMPGDRGCIADRDRPGDGRDRSRRR